MLEDDDSTEKYLCAPYLCTFHNTQNVIRDRMNYITRLGYQNLRSNKDNEMKFSRYVNGKAGLQCLRYYRKLSY